MDIDDTATNQEHKTTLTHHVAPSNNTQCDTQ